MLESDLPTSPTSPTIAGLRAAWRASELTVDFSAEFERWLHRERADRHWWLAVDEHDAAVGMVTMQVFNRMPAPDALDARWGYLSNLFVLPDHRGHGVGRALIDAVLDRARLERMVRVVLSPSAKSVDLYRRRAFGPADALRSGRRSARARAGCWCAGRGAPAPRR